MHKVIFNDDVYSLLFSHYLFGNLAAFLKGTLIRIDKKILDVFHSNTYE